MANNHAQWLLDSFRLSSCRVLSCQSSLKSDAVSFSTAINSSKFSTMSCFLHQLTYVHKFDPAWLHAPLCFS
eukprot:1154367-Pelagomonas_calceolata.AAC.3